MNQPNRSLKRIANSKIMDIFIKGYGKLFLLNNQFQKDAANIFEKLNSDRLIIRSIEFSPEYHQAGMSILSYFNKIINDKYPDIDILVKIEQDDLKVRLVIETPDGYKEIVEKTLEDYGKVLDGSITVENLTGDSIKALDLKHQLRLAIVQVESQKEILQIKDKMNNDKIRNIEQEVEWLKNLLGNVLSYAHDTTKAIQISNDNIMKFMTSNNETINSALTLIQRKIDIGISEEDEEKIVEALQNINKIDKNKFKKIKEYLLDLIVKGIISGTAANLLSKWLGAFFK